MVLILVSYLLMIMSSCLVEAVIVVDRSRDGQDIFTRNTSVPCRLLKAHHQTATTCRCNFNVRTFGGNNPPCTSFPQCTMLNGGQPVKGVGLIRQNTTSHLLRYDDCDIDVVKLWNIPTYLNEIGEWVDVTSFTLRYFEVTPRIGNLRQRFLNVRIPFEAWQGQLIKVLFNCETQKQRGQKKAHCAVFKVEGRVTYPFIISQLNPNPTNPGRPICFEDLCSEEDEQGPDDGGSGGIIAGIVAAVIVLTIGVILVRVCRHKLPCWDLPSPTAIPDNETDIMEPTSSKSTTEYEELLLASQMNNGDISAEQDVPTYDNGDVRNEVNNDEGIGEYEVPTPRDDGEQIGVYYSTIDTLPHDYEPPQQNSNTTQKTVKTSPNQYEQLQPASSSPAYSNYEPVVGSDSDTRGSVSSPVYHTVDEDNA